MMEKDFWGMKPKEVWKELKTKLHPLSPEEDVVPVEELYEDFKQKAICRTEELAKLPSFDSGSLIEAKIADACVTSETSEVPKLKINEKASEIVYYVLSKRPEMKDVPAEELGAIADEIVNRFIVSKVIKEDNNASMKAPEPSMPVQGLTVMVGTSVFQHTSSPKPDEDNPPF